MKYVVPATVDPAHGAASVIDMVMEASPLLLPCDEEHAATAATRADAASAQASFLNLALGELTTLPPRVGEAPLLWSMLSPFAHFVCSGGIATSTDHSTMSNDLLLSLSYVLMVNAK